MGEILHVYKDKNSPSLLIFKDLVPFLTYQVVSELNDSLSYSKAVRVPLVHMGMCIEADLRGKADIPTKLYHNICS